MATECIAEQFDFGTVEGRAVEATFDAGLVTSDAGALLLRATDRAIGLMDRFAACFHDERRRKLIEHEVTTLVGQRVFAIALGYEDLNDHDELRHDPMMAVSAGKLEARRTDCAPVAGKSTLNRLELSELTPTRYHKISHNPIAIRTLLVDLFLRRMRGLPGRSFSTSMRRMIRCTASRRGGSSTAHMGVCESRFHVRRARWMTWPASGTSSNSHSVAVRSGCTNIPRAAGGAQEDGTILIRGFSSQPWNRFVHLDLPGLIRSQEITESG